MIPVLFNETKSYIGVFLCHCLVFRRRLDLGGICLTDHIRFIAHFDEIAVLQRNGAPEEEIYSDFHYLYSNR